MPKSAMQAGRARRKDLHLMLNTSDKRSPLANLRQEDWDRAREAYFLEHIPGLTEYHAEQERAFSQIEDEAQARYPDLTLEDIAAAEAAEAALPYRKRTEAQLRRSFEPLSSHLPTEVKNKRKRFVQKHQRAWNRANPTPLTPALQRALTAEFKKTYAKTARS
jgi:hypothetical protein